MTKLEIKNDDVVQWYTQAGNLITDLKVKIYLSLSEFSTTKIMMWECHVDDSNKIRCNMSLGKYLLA